MPGCTPPSMINAPDADGRDPAGSQPPIKVPRTVARAQVCRFATTSWPTRSLPELPNCAWGKSAPCNRSTARSVAGVVADQRRIEGAASKGCR